MADVRPRIILHSGFMLKLTAIKGQKTGRLCAIKAHSLAAILMLGVFAANLPFAFAESGGSDNGKKSNCVVPEMYKPEGVTFTSVGLRNNCDFHVFAMVCSKDELSGRWVPFFNVAIAPGERYGEYLYEMKPPPMKYWACNPNSTGAICDLGNMPCDAPE